MSGTTKVAGIAPAPRRIRRALVVVALAVVALVTPLGSPSLGAQSGRSAGVDAGTVAEIEVRDALFGIAQGSWAEVVGPDGSVESWPIENGTLLLGPAPPGEYEVHVDGLWPTASLSVSLPSAERPTLRVFTWYDYLAALQVLLLLCSLAVAGWRREWFALPVRTGTAVHAPSLRLASPPVRQPSSRRPAPAAPDGSATETEARRGRWPRARRNEPRHEGARSGIGPAPVALPTTTVVQPGLEGGPAVESGELESAVTEAVLDVQPESEPASEWAAGGDGTDGARTGSTASLPSVVPAASDRGGSGSRSRRGRKGRRGRKDVEAERLRARLDEMMQAVDEAMGPRHGTEDD